jgi:hypothetical protein
MELRRTAATDVNTAVPDSWAAANWAQAITDNVTDGSNPRATATREQMASLIYRALGYKVQDGLPEINCDAPSAWAAQTWAQAVKDGVTDGTFPRERITREQAIAMLYRAMHEDNTEGVSQTTPPETSTDAQPSAWAAGVWQKAVDDGVTDGTNPKSAATREQVVALIYRAMAVYNAEK